jgi:hypothetical protein
MAIKQAAVLKIMEEAAKARLLTASLSEISGAGLRWRIRKRAGGFYALPGRLAGGSVVQDRRSDS